MQKNEYLTTEQVKVCLATYLNFDLPDLALALLSKQPLSKDGPKEWMDFPEVTARAALITSCICRDGGRDHPGYGVDGREHLVVQVVSWLDAYAMEMVPIGPYWMDDGTNERNQKAFRLLVNHPRTRQSVGEAVDQLFEPHLDKPLAQLFFSEPNASGFYHEIYSGDPDSVAEGLGEYRSFPEVKRMVFRDPFHEHQMSVFRSKRSTEGKNRAYEVEAVIHTMDGKLIAKVGLLLMYSGHETSAEDILMHFDETDQSDAQETGIRLVELYTNGVVSWESLQRVCLIRNFEVVPAFRGNGLGVDLLVNAIKIGAKNLPNVRLFAARLTPAAMSVPPYAGMTEHLYPALVQPVQRLQSYWESVVWPVVKKSNKDASFAKIDYIPGCWRGHQTILYSVGVGYQMARAHVAKLAATRLKSN
jgi:hypothetical protein